MNKTTRYSFFCAATLFVVAAQSLQAHAQAVSRVKAQLVSINGQVLRLELASDFSPTDKIASASNGNTANASEETNAASNGKNAATQFSVTILPSTKIVFAKHSSLDALEAGEYAGAVVKEGHDGHLTAQQIYLYADPLRGTGEGRFFDFGRLMVNGTVDAVQIPRNGSEGLISIHYRGADWTENSGRPICEGRAAPPALVSPLACNNDAIISVSPSTPVSEMVVGDASLLVPGAMLSLSILKTDGKQVSPGIVVEKPQ